MDEATADDDGVADDEAVIDGETEADGDPAAAGETVAVGLPAHAAARIPIPAINAVATRALPARLIWHLPAIATPQCFGHDRRRNVQKHMSGLLERHPRRVLVLPVSAAA